MMSVSLDGFMEGANHELDWHRVDDELHRHFNEELAAMGAFLGGRVTHELMAAYWPTADADPATGEGKAEPSDRALCAFGTEDIEGDHATLRAQGVAVDAVIATKGTQRQGLIALDVTIADPIPPQFSFRDPDGNRFLIVQPV